jgi:hypothetical protein
MNTPDLHVALVAIEAMPYLTRLDREPTVDDFDAALGAGYRRLESQLPFDEVCELYGDLDTRWETYREALRERFATRSEKNDSQV